MANMSIDDALIHATLEAFGVGPYQREDRMPSPEDLQACVEALEELGVSQVDIARLTVPPDTLEEWGV